MKYFTFVIYGSLLLTSCMNTPKNFDYQGHRGARGLLPENTIPGFHKALDLGVTTLELDLSVTGDSQLVISHEPWFSHEISTHPDGLDITAENERQFALYRMTYPAIQKFDVGLKPHPRFPSQEKIPVEKPLFKDMVTSIEARLRNEKREPVWYNIETKSLPPGDNLFHPAPEEFVKLVLDEITALGIQNRVIVQSFDLRTLKVMHAMKPEIPLALLVESAAELADALQDLGFVPAIYSPNYEDLTPELIRDAKSRKMKVIPWTVNEVEDMKRLKSWGVDGLISDYPDRFEKLH